MKKFTFMLMTAFIAVAAMAAGPQKHQQMVQKMDAAMTKSTKQLVPKAKAVQGLQASVAGKFSKAQSAKTTARKAQKKAGIEDFLTKEMMLCSYYYEYNETTQQVEPATPTAGGHVITFSMVDMQTVAVSGFTSEATEPIQASFAPTTDPELQAEGIVAEVSIPDGQTLYETEHGPIVLQNITGENEGDPIKAYVYEDGGVVFANIWADVIGGDGEYAGSMYSGLYYESAIMPVNGKMTGNFIEEEEVPYEVSLVIYQDPETPKYATIYNFGGYETAVTVNMKEDNTFTINEQPIIYDYNSQSYLYLAGLTSDYYLETLSGVGTENTLTFNGNWMLYAGNSVYVLSKPATITLTEGTFLYPYIEDVAATPANPEIIQVSNYDASKGYGYVLLDIPTTDVDGKDLKEANLYYQLYSDINGDIQPITFTTDLYTRIGEEDMSIIPYTFTDSYDFDIYNGNKLVYLNYNFNTMYDRIGVKSIYTGGGETNESEIVWADVEKVEPIVDEGGEYTFDFNTMDVATSSKNSTDGDILETIELTEGDVTLAISPKTTSSTPNRFWATDAGPQLRVYSGTLTFGVPEGSVITKIVFNQAKWNQNNSFDSGEFDATTNTWTGSAQTVVLSIAANTQINSIVVTVAQSGGDEPDDDELVVLPEGLETEVWTIEGTFYDSDGPLNIQRATEVAFDGTDVYVKGIPFYYEDAWMKGTLDAETNIITFPSVQFVGEDDYGKEYVVGTEDQETFCDILFAYDAEAKTLTQITKYIVENEGKTQINAWGYLYDMVIYAGEPIIIDPVTAPEGLQTETYLFSAMEVVANEDDEDDEEISDGGVTFNFNAMEVATSDGNGSTDGDITETLELTEGDVTLSVSPKEEGKTIENRFWATSAGPQLRVYSGTLTFSVPEDYVITQIAFNAAKWNEGNAADSGEFDGSTWTGNAQTVVVSIAANTQLNSIVVTVAEAGGEPNDDMQPYTYQTQVGFDGNDVYFKGFSENTSELWAKGTLSEDGKTVTIPANQFMGTLDVGGMGWFFYDYYLTAVDENGNMVDLVLNYDAESQTFTTEQTMVLNEGKRNLNPYQIFTSVVITKMQDFAATPADPILEGYDFERAAGYNTIYASIPTVDVDGNELLTSKLFYTIWIEKDGTEQPYTFTAALYSNDFEEDMTEIPYSYNGYDIYGGGEIIYLEDAVEELATWKKVGIQSIYYGGGERNVSNIVWTETSTGIASLRQDEKNAPIFNLAGQRVQKAQKGLYIMKGKKVLVK